MRFTDGELATTPPHRVEHPVVNYRPEDVQLGKGRVPPRGGARPTVIERASFLALAVQVSWPEDPTTPEGKLVASLQNEKGSTPTRVTALKVCVCVCAYAREAEYCGYAVSVRHQWTVNQK